MDSTATRSISGPMGTLTVEDLRELVEGCRFDAKVRVTITRGDRPFDLDHITLSVEVAQ